MKIHYPLLAALLLAATPSLANDASFSGIAGSPTLSKGEHTQIRMESEKVVLTLRAGDLFETDANFVFVNDSNRATTVRMGFPETNYGDGWEGDGSRVGFKKFATTVNGRAVAAKRTIIDRENGNVWWIKTVSFAPRERKNVRVMATSELGGSVDYMFHRALSYNFTGKNWKGLVSRSDLEVRIPLAGNWMAVGDSWNEGADKRTSWKPNVEVKNGVAYLRKSWRNWQAQSVTTIGVRRVMPDWLIEFPATNLMLTEDALAHMATFHVGPASATLSPVDSNPPHAFMSNGVAMVSFDHLARVTQNSKRGYNAATRTASLQTKGTKLSFAPGNRAMTVVKNGQSKEIALPVAPVLVPMADGERALYVPLAAAGELGLPFVVNAAARRFRLGN